MKKCLAVCNKIINLFGSLIIAFVVILIFSQGVTRYFWGVTVKWTEDIASLLLVVVVFVGIGIVEQDDGHIKMDLVYSLLPNITKRVRLIAYFLTFIFAGFAIYCEVTYLPSVSGRTISPMVDFPLSFFHWCMLIGLIYWAISIIYNFCATFTSKEKK